MSDLRRGETGSKAINASVAACQPKNEDAYTVATVPEADENVGRTIYVSDGADGSPCVAVSDGTDWLRVAVGAAIDDGA